jgi:hypothetical protein
VGEAAETGVIVAEGAALVVVVVVVVAGGVAVGAPAEAAGAFAAVVGPFAVAVLAAADEVVEAAEEVGAPGVRRGRGVRAGGFSGPAVVEVVDGFMIGLATSTSSFVVGSRKASRLEGAFWGGGAWDCVLMGEAKAGCRPW